MGQREAYARIYFKIRHKKDAQFPLDNYLYINLRRSRDCLWMYVCRDLCVCGCMCVGMCLRASFTYFGEMLRCPHKRIVTITRVYIARNNIHVEIIRFRKN